MIQTHLDDRGGTMKFTPEQILEKLGRLYFLQSKIKLLINPTKELQKELLDKVDKVVRAASSDETSIMEKAIGELNFAGQNLFRDTWLKVKNLK